MALAEYFNGQPIFSNHAVHQLLLTSGIKGLGIPSYHLNTFRPNGVYILRGLSSHQSGARLIFIQQISVLNILNMLHNLRFSLFKMPFIS
jgi:hypothetical protein